MKNLRHKFVLRTFCLITALLILNGAVFPTISYALTTGPHQPEFTSYEDASATDMVNLTTGDFTFNLPILSVPIGSDDNFTVPLSYHSGIGPEQEASWVGLGWNINVGSITRSINGYPDDANGEPQVVTVKDLTGVRGWTSNILGSTLGWNSDEGHYGSVNLLALTVNYKNGDVSSVGIAGFDIGSKITFSAAQFASYVMSAVMTYATWGVGEAAITPLKVALNTGIGLAMDAILPEQTPGAGPAGYWRYKKRTDRRLFHTNYWITLNQTRTEDMYGVLNVDEANQNSDAGSTYIDSDYFVKIRNQVNGASVSPVKRFIKSSSVANKGSASDVNMNLDETSSYKDNKSPAMLAYDNFNVSGPGISGNIKPYRLEVGSVSAPREMTSKHIRLNPIQYMDYGSSKVPFVYEGSGGNRYFHHVGASSAVTQPDFFFGVGSSKVNIGGSNNTQALRYELNDVVFSSERIRADVASNKKIPQGNYVDWLTNSEIKNTTGNFTNGYIDYFDGGTNGPRFQFRNTYAFASSFSFYGQSASSGAITLQNAPGALSNYFAVNDIVDVTVCEFSPPDANGIETPTYTELYGRTVTAVSPTTVTINYPLNVTAQYNRYITVVTRKAFKADDIIGSYVITGADGMSYHYAIPVYDFNFISKSVDKNDANKSTTISRGGQFANSWLLTAITGPDYVDRGGTNNAGNGVIDDNDWGYWVKFNYGRHSANASWRIPYLNNTTTRDPDNKLDVYSSGSKEKFFLNAIETRSHVALFIKDSRRDGKDAGGSPSLRLAEIALLTKEAYLQLTDQAGAYQMKASAGNVDCMYYQGSPDYNVLASDNITGTKSTFIQANAIKRIVFNSDYSLCNGASNSDTGYGKLTLKSVSVLGKNNEKIFPDYKFGYTHNPNYDVNKWDGWGMYNINGTSAYNTHQASVVDSDGWAWTLNSIKSPEGNEIVVEYERDDYSTISGVVAMSPYSVVPTDQYIADLTTNVPAGQFSENERVRVKRIERYNCTDAFGVTTITDVGENSIDGTVQGTTVTIDYPFSSATSHSFFCPGGGTVWSYYQIVVQKIGAHKKGGNCRVKSIAFKDDVSGVENKSRYLYTKDTQPWTTSSGVVSVEPDYVKDFDQNFYSWIGYPTTPVMYGTVTILTGKLSTDADYVTKQVYEFETPHRDLYSLNTEVLRDKELFNSYGTLPTFKDYRTEVKNQIGRRLSRIGKLKSMKTFDNTATLRASQEMLYTETPLNDGVYNYQGIFTEGCLLFEIVQSGDYERYHKAVRTTVIDYPYIVKRVINRANGATSEDENVSWDLITGAVLETQSKSGLGLRFKTVNVPAYSITQYAELGSKAVNASYKNMLTQQAASYTYRIDNTGNELGLVEANVDTWSKEWSNYRKLTGGTVYGNSHELDENGNGTLDASETAKKVWRINEKYSWKGNFSRLQADGTHSFSGSDKFNFASPGSNTLWQKLGSQDRYSHTSQLLESRDLDATSSSKKYGYGERYIVSSADNSKYEEFTFSGAEDRLTTTSNFFGGEVALGSGTIVTSPVHTGTKALSVASGYGFVFKSSSVSPENGVVANKQYRASVWANSTNGRIYYKINGGAEVCPTPVISPAVSVPGGTWYRIDLLIPVGSVSNPSIEVGVKSLTGTVVFDDFRFQPNDATVTAYVYNPVNFNLEYVLDNDNVYTRYEYNNRGLLVKTYSEIIKYGGEKLISEGSDNFRRFHVDQ